MAGFAVIDLETTGVNWHRDRVIEIGVVLLDQNLNNETEIETLINPDRHIGAQEIHGIRAGWVLDAPRFVDFAPQLVEILQGRTFVAHNAAFDLHFTEQELRRLSPEWEFAWLDNGIVAGSLCTKKLSAHIFGSQAQNFAWLTRELDVQNSNSHSAIGDARATAEVFQKIYSSSETARDEIRGTTNVSLPVFQKGSCTLRSRPASTDSRISNMDRLMDSLPLFSTEESAEAYTEALLGFIRDFELSEHQIRDLRELAQKGNLSSSLVQKIHLQVFTAISAHFWSNDHLSDFERSALTKAAAELGVEAELLSTHIEKSPDSSEEIISAPETGLTIVLTGLTSSLKEQISSELIDMGHCLKTSVSKKVDFVIALDPDSLSGKAKRGRELGIPVLGLEFVEYLRDRALFR